MDNKSTATQWTGDLDTMYEKMLNENSKITIEDGKYNITVDYNENNQAGSLGQNDLIHRHDAVRLLGEMNIKLTNTYRQAKEQNPNLADELLTAHEILSYAMWGLREIEPAVQINEDCT